MAGKGTMRYPQANAFRPGARLLAALAALIVCLPQAALAEPGRADESEVSRATQLPLSLWTDAQVRPRGVVIAIHGLLMHGLAYDAMARTLASRGFVVVAPDLRGCGRWLLAERAADRSRLLNYERSYRDIVAIARRLKADYPGLPLFLVGESMGADLAIRVAAQEPDLVSGLVLASPAIKGRLLILPRVFYEVVSVASHPLRAVDLTPYVRRCASDDPRVPEEILSDPLARKRLSVLELWRSLSTVKRTLCLVKQIRPATPVLVIQGSADRTLKANAVMLLLARLRSVDQTIKWFPDRGHILLETAYLRPATMQVVEGWLDSHVGPQDAYQAASHPGVTPVSMD